MAGSLGEDYRSYDMFPRTLRPANMWTLIVNCLLVADGLLVKRGLVIRAAALLVVGNSCAVKKFAIKKVGDSLNSGPSVFESDDDIELVGDVLPFSVKFVETLFAEGPSDPDLLITACRGFALADSTLAPWSTDCVDLTSPPPGHPSPP